MAKKVKKVFSIVFFLFFLVLSNGCGTIRETEYVLNKENNITRRLPDAYIEYNSEKYIISYTYIKERGQDYEIKYIITPSGDIYIVSRNKVQTK